MGLPPGYSGGAIQVALDKRDLKRPVPGCNASFSLSYTS